MAQPFFRRNKFFNLIAEKNDPDFVVVLYCRKSKHGSNFGHHFLFEPLPAAEFVRSAHIYQQSHRKLAFLIENFYIRVIEPRRNIPVDISDVIAVLVFPYFAESHAATLERTVILSGENLVGQASGFDLNLADFFKDIAGFHQKLT